MFKINEYPFKVETEIAGAENDFMDTTHIELSNSAELPLQTSHLKGKISSIIESRKDSDGSGGTDIHQITYHHDQRLLGSIDYDFYQFRNHAELVEIAKEVLTAWVNTGSFPEGEAR